MLGEPLRPQGWTYQIEEENRILKRRLDRVEGRVSTPPILTYEVFMQSGQKHVIKDRGVVLEVSTNWQGSDGKRYSYIFTKDIEGMSHRFEGVIVLVWNQTEGRLVY